MDEFDSGGRGSDKGLGADDEGGTAPLPERVSVICLLEKKMSEVSLYPDILCNAVVLFLF